jgi:acyl phosphate:glycerol-3-phosphate acyltransferase
MIQAALAIIVSYLIGSLSGSLLIGKLRGVDIRKLGSGNAGATNAFRTQGKGFALATVLVDAAKGVIAAVLIAKLWPHPLSAFACSLAAALGHCFPIFFSFRGGKGAGTAIAALACLQPYAALLALSIWILCLIASGYVGPSTVVASISAAIYLVAFTELSASAKIILLAMLALIVFQHRDNLSRLIKGRENRFEKARLLRRWFSKRN